MKKNPLIFILFTLIFGLSSAQNLKKEQEEIVLTFIDYVKNKNIDKLKFLVSYPLKRQYPISEIKNEDEFIKRYNEVFDNDLITEISKSKVHTDWSSVGWRGIMLNEGTLWLDIDGKLRSINYQSDIERIKRIKLIETEKKTLHKSLLKFEEPISILETKKFRIRIDKLENGFYRYASWSINSKMNTKPDLIITNGKRISHGSGGNHSYDFNNGNYKYKCLFNILGTEYTPSANLLVYKSGEVILTESIWCSNAQVSLL